MAPDELVTFQTQPEAASARTPAKQIAAGKRRNARRERNFGSTPALYQREMDATSQLFATIPAETSTLTP